MVKIPGEKGLSKQRNPLEQQIISNNNQTLAAIKWHFLPY